MRVLHIITDTNIGGAGRYLLNLLVQPAFDDIDVVVACPDGDLAQRIDNAGLKRINISGKDISFSVPLTFELMKVMRQITPALVHTHSSLSGRIAARVLRIPVVYTKHNLVRIPSGLWAGSLLQARSSGDKRDSRRDAGRRAMPCPRVCQGTGVWPRVHGLLCANGIELIPLPVDLEEA